MVVEINFLEGKKKQTVSPVLMILSLLLILVLVGGSYYQVQLLNKQEEKLTGLLSSYENQREYLSDMVSENSSDFLVELQAAIESIQQNEDPLLSKTIQEMVALLPTNGSIETFAFQDNIVNLSIRSNTLRDVSYYTNHLQNAHSLQEAHLHEINQMQSGEYIAHYEITLKEDNKNAE